MLQPRWSSSVVRVCTLTTTPMELILPGRSGPRHVKQGLAIFTLDLSAPIQAPRLLEPSAPVLAVAAQQVVVVDTAAEALPQLLAKLHSADFAGVLVRDPTMSFLGSSERKRLTVNLISPTRHTELEILLTMRTLRTWSIGKETFYRP